jgi:hypothetical protein
MCLGRTVCGFPLSRWSSANSFGGRLAPGPVREIESRSAQEGRAETWRSLPVSRSLPATANARPIQQTTVSSLGLSLARRSVAARGAPRPPGAGHGPPTGAVPMPAGRLAGWAARPSFRAPRRESPLQLVGRDPPPGRAQEVAALPCHPGAGGQPNPDDVVDDTHHHARAAPGSSRAVVAVEPLLPGHSDAHPLGCHRARVSDRLCFPGLMIRLVAGA